MSALPITAVPVVDAPGVDKPGVDAAPVGLAGSLAERARHLRSLPAPSPTAPRGPYLLVMAALLAFGLLGLLLLNTTLAQGAFVTHDLQAQTAALADQEQALVQQVSEKESPTVLERRARALGMVPSTTPVFLRLSDGAVLGVPEPAKAAPKPKPQPKVLPDASGVATGSGNAVAPTGAAKPTVAAPTAAAPKTATKPKPKPTTGTGR